MKLRQMAILSALSLITILSDYTAISSYSILQVGSSAALTFQGLSFRLPFYLILKLTLTPLFTHIFSCLILNRFFVLKSIFYFLVALLGLLVHEFTVWDYNNENISYSISSNRLGGFKIIIPSIYTFNTSGSVDTSVYIYQWLPHMLVLLSSLCNGLIPVLSKSYIIQHAH